MTNDSAFKSWKPWLGASALVIPIASSAGYFYWRLDRAGNLAEWGSKGDALAPFAALLSAFALLAAVASVVLQSRELAEQREEMKRSSEAQERIAAAQLEANRLALETVQTQREVARSQISSEREIAAVQLNARAEANRQATRARLLQVKVELLKVDKETVNAVARGHWHTEIDKALGELGVAIPPEVRRLRDDEDDRD